MKKLLLVILFSFGLSVVAQSNAKLIVKNKIDHLSTLAREPMVCEHPNGSLFVSGYRNGSSSPQLWKSDDAGNTWQSVNVGTAEQGAIGNSDADLYIDKKGNIYLLSMTFSKLPENLEDFDYSSMKGERISVGISKDEGQSWNWKTISEKDYDDRPWITGTTDGSLHIIWNDGQGVHHAMSTNEGGSWQKQPDISTKGGSSFLASGYNGQLATRVTPLSASGLKMDEGIDLVRLSLDNGKSWSDVIIPGNREWTKDFTGVPRWVEPLVFDDNDRLFLLWSEGKTLKLGISNDNGSSWDENEIAQSADTLYYPYMEVSKQGILCTWVSGFKDGLRSHSAVINFEKEKLAIAFLEPQKLDIWYQGETYNRSTAGEYISIIPLSNGNFGMVTTIQNPKANRAGFTWWELELLRM